jgi:hypothetical protein
MWLKKNKYINISYVYIIIYIYIIIMKYSWISLKNRNISENYYLVTILPYKYYY